MLFSRHRREPLRPRPAPFFMHYERGAAGTKRTGPASSTSSPRKPLIPSSTKQGERLCARKRPTLKLVINQTPFHVDPLQPGLCATNSSQPDVCGDGSDVSRSISRAKPSSRSWAKRRVRNDLVHIETVLRGHASNTKRDVTFNGVGIRSLRVPHSRHRCARRTEGGLPRFSTSDDLTISRKHARCWRASSNVRRCHHQQEPEWDRHVVECRRRASVWVAAGGGGRSVPSASSFRRSASYEGDRRSFSRLSRVKRSRPILKRPNGSEKDGRYAC